MTGPDSAQFQSVCPSSAPLKAPGNSGDLTLAEIETTINILSLQPRQTIAAVVAPDAKASAQPEQDYRKAKRLDREVRHLDASATTSMQPVSSTVKKGERLQSALPAGAGSDARANGSAGATEQASGSRPQCLDISNLGDLPPSRANSPALSQSGSRRTSPKVWSSAEIDSPSPDGTGVNDSFTQQIMAGAMKLKTSLFKPERISFTDVARNPALAKRARAEMDNHQFKGMIEGSDGQIFEGRPHDLEVTRLQVVLDVVEADAEEESKINSQLGQIVCLRLEASRRAVERMLGLLQAITAAEAAYTRSMNAASRVKVVSECDGLSLRTALNRFLDIPWLAAEAHSLVQSGMVETTRRCQEMVQELRKECQDISHDSTKAQASVVQARRALHSAFLAHRSTCRTADDVALEKARSSRASSSARLELDPWVTESRVVAAHMSLHAAQTHQRGVLATAYQRVRHNELHRCEGFKDTAHAFLLSYRNELGRDTGEEDSIRGSVDAVDCEQDLAQFTASAAAAVETGKELAARQAAALESTSQDLLCSPDIIRQGEMARWVSGAGRWSDCHFILTRTGFLHWLAAAQDITPLGSLNLSKCQFEAGEAPQFNINEHQGGIFGKAKRICFKAPTVEDSCEWAIALREMIAAHKVR